MKIFVVILLSFIFSSCSYENYSYDFSEQDLFTYMFEPIGENSSISVEANLRKVKLNYRSEGNIYSQIYLVENVRYLENNTIRWYLKGEDDIMVWTPETNQLQWEKLKDYGYDFIIYLDPYVNCH